MTRVVLISQWPDVKNAEYELLSKIQKSSIETTILDYKGFDVNTGEFRNNSRLMEEFDFAISFHYDTPCWLNIPTVHWLANPKEFMLLRHDYPEIRNRLKSYRHFVDNGSENLVENLRQIIGNPSLQTIGQFYPSVSENEIKCPLKLEDKNKEDRYRLFYCGINWEKGSGNSGREDFFLKELDRANHTNFFGPKWFEGFQPWAGFENYRGEIPFDGYSLSSRINEHLASICLSSPAHIKSKTSSSRVFESIAAGVPAISDINNHVVKLFGESVYYFDGASSPNNLQQIEAIHHDIVHNYDEASAKVIEAQELLKNKYSFESSLTKIKSNLDDAPVYQTELSFDVFFVLSAISIINLEDVLECAACLANAIDYSKRKAKSDISLHIVSDLSETAISKLVTIFHNKGINAKTFDQSQIDASEPQSLKAGETLIHYGSSSSADLVVMLDHQSFVFYDHFINAAEWFENPIKDEQRMLYVAGHYSIDLKSKDASYSNKPNHEYKWTAQSAFEHELSALVFRQCFFACEGKNSLRHFDSLLPIAAVVFCIRNSYSVYRSSKISIRQFEPSFNKAIDAYKKAQEKGFWNLHYSMKSNYEHEYNLLFDLTGESSQLFKIVSSISNKNWLIDPHYAPHMELQQRIHRITRLIDAIIPLYRFLKKCRNKLLSAFR